MKLVNLIAETVVAIHNCEASNNAEWLQRHTARLDMLIDAYLPSGSGWDCGTKIDIARSNAVKLMFTGSFHHMDENGCYDDWTEHTIAVRASFLGLDIIVSGLNRNDVKDDIAERFRALDEDIDRDAIATAYANRGI